MGLIARVRNVASDLGASLWFLPSVGVLTAVFAGTLLSRLQVASGFRIASLLYAGDAAGARGLLQAIAGSMISVTGVTFSLTVVALQLASAQYSPRLLQNFLRDRGNKVVLTGFLSTFAYAIAVLRTIGTSVEDEPAAVPSLAVTGAIILTLTSLGLLVYFVNHLAQSIRVESIIDRAQAATLDALHGQYPDDDHEQLVGDVPPVPAAAETVVARRSGYLRYVDLDSLAACALEHGVRVQLHASVGDHLIQGGDLAWVWRPVDSAQPIDSDALADELDGSLFVGQDRTLAQDVGLGVRQLADIAVKALSPGVNDPTSAIQTMNALTVIFVTLARQPLGHRIRRDDRGDIVVLVPDAPLERYLPKVAGQIRRDGAGHPEVVAGLLRLLGDVGAAASTGVVRELVAREVPLVRRAARRAVEEAADLEEIERLADSALAAVRGRRAAYPTSAA